MIEPIEESCWARNCAKIADALSLRATRTTTVRSGSRNSGLITGSPEVIKSRVGLVPINALVFTDKVSLGQKVGFSLK